MKATLLTRFRPGFCRSTYMYVPEGTPPPASPRGGGGGGSAGGAAAPATGVNEERAFELDRDIRIFREVKHWVRGLM